MNRVRTGIVVAWLLGISACHADGDIDPVTERAIIAAINDLNDAYVFARDRFDAEAYAATFATDGVLSVLGTDYAGRDAIGERLRGAAGRTRSQHLLASREISVVSATEARGVVYAMVFVEVVPDGHAGGPLPFTGPFAVGAYHDEYRLTDRGWKIARREFKPTFLREQP